MKISLARIPEEGEHYKGCEPSDIFEIEDDAFVRPAGDVEYKLYAQHVSGELVVRGTLSSKMDLRCARCSEFFSTTIEDSDFLRAYPAPKETDFVDITADLREDLLLNIPGFPVCSDKCKGLCMQCGKDLNKECCECEKTEGSGAWSALDGLDL